MDNENFNVEFGEVVNIGGGTSDFNQISNRPKYNNTPMTGATNIPKVPTKTSELNNDSDYQTGTEVESAISTAIAGKQDTLTAGNNITISNNTISATDTTYSAGTGLTLDGTQFSVNTETIATQQDVSNEATARENADTNLQGQIDAISASSDVTDIVGTYADLQAYDTTHLKDNDIIKVLQDESQNGETTYYRWSTSTQTFTLIGEEGPYYTKSQADTLLNAKQNTLTAGSNVQIVNDTISATDTTYTAGSGLALNGTQFSVDTTAIATQSDLTAGLATKQDTLTAGANIQINNNVISATDTTYTHFTGTDGTTAGTAGLVPAPATTDAGKFLKADGTWDTAGGGGGSITELTTADYNYDFGRTGSNNGLAVWLMDAGTYYLGENMNLGFVTTGTTPYGAGCLLVVGEGTAHNYVIVVDNNSEMFVAETYSDGSVWNRNNILGKNNLKQTTGTSTTDVMSQNAATSMVFADPSTRGAVRIGNTKNVYAGSVGIGRITGSQYTGASGSFSVAIGSDVSASTNGAVSIGKEADIRGIARGAIALGAYSKATSAGEMNIGSSDTSYGYNNSNYRLLTGLYDGQSAHDAATVAQGNTLSTSAPTTSTVGVLGQLYTDTTNMHTYQCTAISGDTYTWTQRW